MRPEDIQNHDFLVGLRGYDKDEVRTFLGEVAAEHARLLAALEHGQASASQAAAAPAAPAEEDFEGIGANVAAILRTAKQQAGEITGDAQARAAAMLEDAERIVREATERVRQIEVEHDARMKNKAEEIASREEATRKRLAEAADELQLALAALGDGQPVETNHRETKTSALG